MKVAGKEIAVVKGIHLLQAKHYTLKMKDGTNSYLDSDVFMAFIRERGWQIGSSFNGRLRQINVCLKHLGLGEAKNWTLEDY